ncbi:MAG: hypothetical protein U9N19_03485 [Thermodesulfobacteriota bacterium]|nr:hypothetical protein [Thermodesulfobacteriota bacterium]
MKAFAKLTTQLGVIWLICFGLFNLQPVWAATNISDTNKYAWSENVGWQNWHSTNAQATVGITYLVGYVWAENIGWIKLGHTPWEGGQYGNNTKDNWGVNRNSSDGVLSGYAWSENVGWISFKSTNSTAISGTGNFSGYAWGENVGWIHFANTTPAEYHVEQVGSLAVRLFSFTAEGLEDHVLLEWKTASEIDNAGFYLWRTDTKDAEYNRITNYLIQAEGCPTQGAEYSYKDFDVAPGLTYYYQLEDIDYDGFSTFHGPASATMGDEADDIGLIFPEDGAPVPAYHPPTFEWEDAADLVRFKLGFSRSPDFTGKVIVLPRRSSRWITGESYTPNRRKWRRIRHLARRGQTVYWAVYGEDEAGEGFVSKTFELKIEKIERSEAISFHRKEVTVYGVTTPVLQ